MKTQCSGEDNRAFSDPKALIKPLTIPGPFSYFYPVRKKAFRIDASFEVSDRVPITNQLEMSLWNLKR